MNNSEIEYLLSQDSENAWPRAIDIWMSSPLVYAGPTGPDAFVHHAYYLAQLAPKFIPDIKTRLEEGLQYEHPIVVAYCALTLSLILGHELPENYIEMVKHRSELVEVRDGCFGQTQSLAEFAEYLE